MRLQVTCGAVLAVGVLWGSGATAHETAHQDADAGDLVALLESRFEPGALVEAPRIVNCTLSGGTESTCVSITIGKGPAGYDPGPWCPRNIADGPETAGIWIEGGKVYDADGPFIEDLSTFYHDDGWQLFDPETGAINVTDTKAACAAAAKPDVEPAYFNYCVECQVSDVDDDLTLTFVIPVAPVDAPHPARLSRAGIGVAFSGVRLDEPAPVEAILGAYTLAPFDDCGGHVNLHAGYHVHAVTDCLRQVSVGDDHAPLVGLALDGHLIHARLDGAGQEPQGLDRCRGHAHGDDGYHYHVSDPGKNQILGCLTAETGCSFAGGERYCDATKQPPRP